MTFKRILCLWLLVFLPVLSASLVCQARDEAVARSGLAVDQSFAVSRQDCEGALAKVDRLVRKNFYNASASSTAWPRYLAQHKQEILSARDLKELCERMNAALKTLKSSHCEFATTNDEIYYFLNAMFSVFNKNIQSPTMNYTGAITGGVNCRPHRVRYVIDGSPAQLAGVKIGDEIVAVDGRPFAGQVNFWGTAGHSIRLTLSRRGRVRLEGAGVTPDLIVPGECSQEGSDRQLAVATSLLCELVSKGKH